jgi:hypothetical protein
MKSQKIAFGIFLIGITLINPGCTHKKPEPKDVYRQYIKYKLFKI